MARLLFFCTLLSALGLVPCAYAHEARPAYLEINETAPNRYDVLWRTPVLSGMRLQRGEASFTARRPWLVAFSFGLLHELGFAGALADIGLPRGDVPLALFTFNVGVELGQLAFIAVVLGLFSLAKRIKLATACERYARPAAPYAIGILAAFWFFERFAGFVT